MDETVIELNGNFGGFMIMEWVNERMKIFNPILLSLVVYFVSIVLAGFVVIYISVEGMISLLNPNHIIWTFKRVYRLKCYKNLLGLRFDLFLFKFKYLISFTSSLNF